MSSLLDYMRRQEEDQSGPAIHQVDRTDTSRTLCGQDASSVDRLTDDAARITCEDCQEESEEWE